MPNGTIFVLRYFGASHFREFPDEEHHGDTARRSRPMGPDPGCGERAQRLGWLAELLESMRRQDDGYAIAMKQFLAVEPRRLEWIDGRKPTREEPI